MNKKAFTLIELLMVMTIIGILVATIVPLLSWARENAWMAQCSNNLRQIGIAMHMYIDEHDFKFPPLGSGNHCWYHDLDPYLDDRDVFKCPYYPEHDYNDPSHFSYGYNYQGLEGVDINNVISPSHCIIVTDTSKRSIYYPYRWYAGYSITAWSGFPPPTHRGGANILFVDGHVRWYHHDTREIPIDWGFPDRHKFRLWWNYEP